MLKIIPNSLPKVRRIFILRPDNLGDLILFSGVLKHIRNHWPAAHITLCVRKFGLELFAHCPYVDRLVSYEKLYRNLVGSGRFYGMPQIRGADRIGEISRKHFPGIIRRPYRSDVAILPILAPFREYHECIKLIPANIKIGICGNLSNQSIKDDSESRSLYSAQMDATGLAWDFPEMEATRLFLEFLGIGAEVRDLWPEFWTTKQDAQRANELMPKNNSKPILGIAPGFSNARKGLAPGWFWEVLKFSDHSRYQVVLLGNKSDIHLCDEIAEAFENFSDGGQILNLAGKTTVREMIECVKHCDFLLSQDNATLHVATALRKPVVGIIGGGHYGRFYPWGDPQLSRPVNKPMDCYGCNWKCKYETVRCIQEIPPAAAARSLNELFAQIFKEKPVPVIAR